MRAVDGHAIDGAVFRLPDQPPYPIGQAHSNVIDQNQVQAAVSALVDRSETIKFDELSWAYWYAKCAPLHAAAAHFGSLIEQLQTNSSGLITVRKSLLEHDAWNGLKGIIHQWLRTMQLDLDVRRIIEGKASGLNHAPAGVVLRRMFEGMGFAMSDLEANAWRHRNSAAHGGFSADPEATIRNSKVLWLLFHRMLAGVTHCSDMYVDYFSLKHPVRLIGEAVPRG